MSIAVVVPTIRQACFDEFLLAWRDLFTKHDVNLIAIRDGDDPECVNMGVRLSDFPELKGLVFNKNDGVRNFGFYLVSHIPECDVIITLDDDTKPDGDTIADHLAALNTRVPLHWMSTASEYVRGIPYGIRDEAEVVLSHGVWRGVADWDAPTQLIHGNRPVDFYKGAIPSGVFYPMCGMNIAFKRKMLPYMYYAPMGPEVGIDRFADIWCGIESKKVIDANGWAVVTGKASVCHNRASSVWKNLQKEAKGLELNEHYDEDDYFKLYKEKREAWQNLIQKLLN